MNDLKFAWRQLCKNPGFSTVAILTLALGIGANTAIFSVINAVLLRPPPFQEPKRLVFVSEKSKDMDDMSVAYPNFLDWQRQQESFSSLAAFRTEEWNLTGTSHPERVVGLQVSAGFFPTLGVQPLGGRVFTAGEDKVGGERVVVLSEGLWRRRFGADPAVLERPVSLNGQSYIVVGILPAAFQFPRRVELWTPLGYKAEWTDQRGWHPGMYVIGRLKSGVDIPAARSDLELIAARLAKEYPNTNDGNGVTLMALQERLAGPSVRTALVMLLGAVLLVLLIACTNVTNLLLARAAQRRKEIAVRLALGAGRWRLLRQVLLESLLLAGAGGLAGLLLAFWGTALLTNLLPGKVREFVTLNIDRTVLLFSFITAVATGLLFGLAPAWLLANGDSADALKEGARGDSSAIGRTWGRRALIVGEVAFALMLLVAAGLLLRSFSRLQAVPVGLDPADVLTMDLSLPVYKYPDDPARARFYRRAAEAVSALPGVKSAAFIAPLPLGFGGWQSGIRIEGEPPAKPGQARLSDFALVTPDYFKTMGVTILKGRAFTDADDGKHRVCIVDETFDRKHFKGDALGKRLANGGDGTNWMTIVGVARHVKNYGAGEDSRIETYEPVAQNAGGSMTLVIKTEAPPLTLSEPARKAILSVDSDQPVADILTMEQVLARNVAERRLAMLLLSLFAALALMLAVVGLYGVMAYNVANRTREIGIRMALGAQVADVLGLVLRQGGSLVLLGVVFGLAGALAVTQLMARLLFQVKTTDLATYLTTPLLLGLAGLLACWLPARRAAKVDPTEALRCE
ncbi:MAG TPA: ABC transporter permease [Candidatus Limnocylindrales bacterium]|nr:ABC transporter permease [Candidatus Limnocylindrales bacterium]